MLIGHNLTFVNVYLWGDANGYMLIDTGIAGKWGALQSFLDSAGCTAENLKLVLLTHGDADHAGNCVNLREKYNVKIAMHQGDFPMVEQGTMPKRESRIKLVNFLLKRGQKKTSPPGFKLFTPDIVIDNQFKLNHYGLSGSIMHLPGHTPGSIGILTEAGEFIIGDTLTHMRKPNRAMLVENQTDYDATIKILKATDFKTVHVGHGKPFSKKEMLDITF